MSHSIFSLLPFPPFVKRFDGDFSVDSEQSDRNAHFREIVSFLVTKLNTITIIVDSTLQIL